MNEDILNTILKDTYTQTQLKRRVSILKTYLLQNLFGSPKKEALEEKDLAWLKSLPVEFIQNFNKDNVSDLLSGLEKAIVGLQTLVLYLTFEPDNLSLTQIGNKTRNMFGNSLMLDIKYDPNLIAGAALVWKGIRRDYSLRAKIEEKKSVILESFKKYLR